MRMVRPAWKWTLAAVSVLLDDLRQCQAVDRDIVITIFPREKTVEALWAYLREENRGQT